MAALPAARAAMDAHRGVAAVAEDGLVFLRNLSGPEANQVSWWAGLGPTLVPLSTYSFVHMFYSPCGIVL
jgi:hypothetical protein